MTNPNDRFAMMRELQEKKKLERLSVLPASVPNVPNVPNRSQEPVANSWERPNVPDVHSAPIVPSVPDVPHVPGNTGNSRAERSRERSRKGNLTAAVSIQLIDAVDEYARRYRLSKQDVVEQALWEFFRAASPVPNVPDIPVVPGAPNVPRNIGNVSMMIDVDDIALGRLSDIISHHLADLTGKILRHDERDAVRELIQRAGNTEELDDPAIRGGICVGLVRTKHPQINSFRYFLNPILEMLELPKGQSREMYARHAERKLETKRSPK